MMMVRNFGRQSAQLPVRGRDRCGLPVPYQGMNVFIGLLVVGYLGFDLSTEIVCVGLVSIVTVIFGRNHNSQHLALRACQR